VQDDRHGDVVRQVRHDRARRGTGHRGHPHRVGNDDGERCLRKMRVDGPRQCPGKHRIDLDRGHGVAGGKQAERQRTESRTDLEHNVAGREVSRAHDATDRVGIVQEVLPEPPHRPHPELSRQRPDLHGPEQHRATGHAGQSLRARL